MPITYWLRGRCTKQVNVSDQQHRVQEEDQQESLVLEVPVCSDPSQDHPNDSAHVVVNTLSHLRSREVRILLDEDVVRLP